jgi:hypothetical protein
MNNRHVLLFIVVVVSFFCIFQYQQLILSPQVRNASLAYETTNFTFTTELNVLPTHSFQIYINDDISIPVQWLLKNIGSAITHSGFVLKEKPLFGKSQIVEDQTSGTILYYKPTPQYYGEDSISYEVHLTSSEAQAEGMYIGKVEFRIFFSPAETRSVSNFSDNFVITPYIPHKDTWYSEDNTPNSMEIFEEKIDDEKIYWRYPNSKRYSTCAIVGNGGILKGKKLGSEIDSHEKVFRFNGAPLIEFKEVSWFVQLEIPLY